MMIILAHARKDLNVVKEVKKCLESETCHIFTMGDFDNRFTVKCITVDGSKIFITSEIVNGVIKVVETCNINPELADFYMYQIELSYKLSNPDTCTEEFMTLNRVS